MSCFLPVFKTLVKKLNTNKKEDVDMSKPPKPIDVRAAKITVKHIHPPMKQPDNFSSIQETRRLEYNRKIAELSSVSTKPQSARKATVSNNINSFPNPSIKEPSSSIQQSAIVQNVSINGNFNPPPPMAESGFNMHPQRPQLSRRNSANHRLNYPISNTKNTYGNIHQQPNSPQQPNSSNHLQYYQPYQHQQSTYQPYVQQTYQGHHSQANLDKVENGVSSNFIPDRSYAADFRHLNQREEVVEGYSFFSRVRSLTGL